LVMAAGMTVKFAAKLGRCHGIEQEYDR